MLFRSFFFLPPLFPDSLGARPVSDPDSRIVRRRRVGVIPGGRFEGDRGGLGFSVV